MGWADMSRAEQNAAKTQIAVEIERALDKLGRELTAFIAEHGVPYRLKLTADLEPVAYDRKFEPVSEAEEIAAMERRRQR